jgi:hypothetical protein
MTTLIDHLATDRLQGGTLVLAYGVGLVFGVVVAAAALIAVAG